MINIVETEEVIIYEYILDLIYTDDFRSKYIEVFEKLIDYNHLVDFELFSMNIHRLNKAYIMIVKGVDKFYRMYYYMSNENKEKIEHVCNNILITPDKVHYDDDINMRNVLYNIKDDDYKKYTEMFIDVIQSMFCQKDIIKEYNGVDYNIYKLMVDEDGYIRNEKSLIDYVIKNISKLMQLKDINQLKRYYDIEIIKRDKRMIKSMNIVESGLFE